MEKQRNIHYANRHLANLQNLPTSGDQHGYQYQNQQFQPLQAPSIPQRLPEYDGKKLVANRYMYNKHLQGRPTQYSESPLLQKQLVRELPNLLEDRSKKGKVFGPDNTSETHAAVIEHQFENPRHPSPLIPIRPLGGSIFNNALNRQQGYPLQSIPPQQQKGNPPEQSFLPLPSGLANPNKQPNPTSNVSFGVPIINVGASEHPAQQAAYPVFIIKGQPLLKLIADDGKTYTLLAEDNQKHRRKDKIKRMKTTTNESFGQSKRSKRRTDSNDYSGSEENSDSNDSEESGKDKKPGFFDQAANMKTSDIGKGLMNSSRSGDQDQIKKIISNRRASIEGIFPVSMAIVQQSREIMNKMAQKNNDQGRKVIDDGIKKSLSQSVTETTVSVLAYY